jgi:hypothetical protein
MYSVLLTAWLCLPLAPINPVEQDTISAMNLHFTAGVCSPTDILSTGPVFSAKWEMLAIHPVIIRSAIDYQYGSFKNRTFDLFKDIEEVKGSLNEFTFSADVLYYRGTNHLTGYIGVGAIYTFGSLNFSSETKAALYENYDITNVTLRPQFGYRLTMGLRYHRIYSLEIAILEIEPNYQVTYDSGINAYSEATQRTDLSGFRISLGYLWTVKKLW